MWARAGTAAPEKSSSTAAASASASEGSARAERRRARQAIGNSDRPGKLADNRDTDTGKSCAASPVGSRRARTSGGGLSSTAWRGNMQDQAHVGQELALSVAAVAGMGTAAACAAGPCWRGLQHVWGARWRPLRSPAGEAGHWCITLPAPTQRARRPAAHAARRAERRGKVRCAAQQPKPALRHVRLAAPAGAGRMCAQRCGGTWLAGAAHPRPKVTPDPPREAAKRNRRRVVDENGGVSSMRAWMHGCMASGPWQQPL